MSPVDWDSAYLVSVVDLGLIARTTNKTLKERQG